MVTIGNREPFVTNVTRCDSCYRTRNKMIEEAIMKRHVRKATSACTSRANYKMITTSKVTLS